MMGLNLVSIEQDTERGNPVGDDRKSSKTINANDAFYEEFALAA